ncbi:hypothetical protein P7C70_g2170, partial [Phenoliferia sp. Uapishka_3]
MQTTDSNNLFQSDAQHAKASYRAAKVALHAETGDPINLASKPLRVVIRQKGNKEAEAWCAESGFVVRRVGLESGKTKQIYRGHWGPVTSLDFFSISPSNTTKTPSKVPRQVLVTGSWDKSVRLWDVQTKTHLSTTLAHTDFVKALIVIPSLQVLITGSSDKDIRVWDLSNLPSYNFDSLATDTTPEVVEAYPNPPSTEFNPNVPIPTGAAPPTPKSLAPLPFIFSLKGHTRPIERLAYYQVQEKGEEGQEDNDRARATTGAVAVVSADSLGALKTWELWRGKDGELRGELRSDIRPHEIGIYDLLVGDGEIWTASADNSILLSTFDPSSPATPPTPTLRIPHPAGVKSLLPLALSMPSLNSTHLLTGSTDESIRIFNLSDLDDSANTISTSTVPWVGLPAAGPLPGVVREVDGHAHDVIELGTFTKEVEGKREAWIMSASLDGTLRRWRWPDMLKAPKERMVLIPVEEPVKENLLTEEEERELEELMGED